MLQAISKREANKAVEQLVALPITVTGTSDIVPKIWRLRDRLTSYDACYVALASTLGAPLITTDEKLAKACGRKEGIVLLLRDAVA